MIKQIADLDVKDDIARLKYVDESELPKYLEDLESKMEEQIRALSKQNGAD